MISVTNELFFAGKFIAGFPLGAIIALSMTYIGELTPLALRGVLTAASAISFTLGPLLVSLIVNWTGTLDSRWAYRSVFVSQYGVTAIGMMLWPFMPESPWWLINKGNTEGALKALRRLGFDDASAQQRVAQISVTLAEVKKETEAVSYAEAFRKSNLRRTIISIAPLSIMALSGVFFVAAYSTYY